MSSSDALAVADQVVEEHPGYTHAAAAMADDWGFATTPGSGSLLALLCRWVERLCAVVLALDVAVVFVSVILRYFVHHPVDWAEEVARGLMVMLVFLGGATVLARKQHVQVDFFRALLPAGWQQAAQQTGGWLVAGTAAGLAFSSWLLLEDSVNVVTPMGLPQWLNVLPVFVGALLMTAVGIANAVNGATVVTWLTLLGCLLVGGSVYAWNTLVEAYALQPWGLLVGGFFGGLLAGVPIAFVLALCALLYFIGDPSLPMVIYSQQVMAGMDHFVLLAIPFFVLAGLLMEANGMSSRLIELLVRLFGRVRGSMNLIAILATAFFSGVSGSKLADIAAVGGIVVPAVRRTRQDPAETAAVLAASGVMAETIPPCINMIIMGFVANISIGGLFLAGIVPAAMLALGLATLAVIFGRKVDPDLAFPSRRPVVRLLGGALVALIMVTMIGKGVTSGVATSTEVSAFAVVYALLVGGLTFRELTFKGIARLFVRSASMAAGILFIIAAASSLAFALTILQIPSIISDFMLALAHDYGPVAFMITSVIIMVVFGAVLEGAPALIIFGPLLVPIAVQVGVSPFHFGTVAVIAMGLGLFSPPFGLGLFATCAMTGTRVEEVSRRMVKYLCLLAAMLILIVLVPSISLWLPRTFNMG
ncbi:TRAP-type C4-dicarboxylate transport system, large permease component [Pseudomonas chlororaphis subsp. aureofaciens]|uniref:TRAP transporter large permease n=1 Tax=Pseudomonas chlororaphis TaxID=587753 RepID=UPI000F6B7D86|nr:TRAP transporter large permease subunit [Pseudomonas chlororaphis]AZE10929.1 TRAP-type C4-dicarboxylate transport system, large permease component [Pseudomonas chlororaphis subsp. aureofaciens]